MKSNKKGFTIVELVIVIAIIAILAAVLIPTFASLVRKANVSADTQLVRNLNMAVEIEKASSSAKHSTMHEALMTAQAAGYDVDTIVAKSGYNIAWDSANDRFVLVDKDAKKYIYPTSENTAENSIGNPADYFLFCDDATKISGDESGFSYYLSKNAKLPENGAVAVKAGFDAGENKNLKEVTYDGNATKVIFNLNGGKLTVNDKTDSNQQYFYGSPRLLSRPEIPASMLTALSQSSILMRAKSLPKPEVSLWFQMPFRVPKLRRAAVRSL